MRAVSSQVRAAQSNTVSLNWRRVSTRLACVMRLVLIALLLFASLPAAAAEPPGEFVPPDWLKKPTPQELAAFYPPEGYSQGHNGKAVINCTVVETGLLEDCSVIEETPPGEGFGEAALKAAATIVMKPATLNGQAVRQEVNIPIAFELPTVAVTMPDWKRKPSGEEIARFIPAEAMRSGVSGRATMECLVVPSGALEGCRIVEETPKGIGFGEAALMASALFVMKPASQDGQPVVSAVRIPIVFKVPDSGASGVMGRPTISRAVWETAPTFEQVAAAWPEGAKGEFGHASLNCGVTREGRLRACRVTGETPSREGFGKAATHELAPLFKLRLPPDMAKQMARTSIDLHIQFTNPAAHAERTIVSPTWITRLDPEKVAAVYPVKAAEAGVRTGRGIADCLVGVNGALTDCRPAEAEPDGYGFSEAAAAVASVMVMNPWSDGGGPVNGVRIRLPVRFNLAPKGKTSPAP